MWFIGVCCDCCCARFAALLLLFLRTQNQTNTQIAVIRIIPPTTPPIMGPRGVFFFFLEFDLIVDEFVDPLELDPAPSSVGVLLFSSVAVGANVIAGSLALEISVTVTPNAPARALMDELCSKRAVELKLVLEQPKFQNVCPIS